MRELNEQGSYLATYTPVAQKNLLLGIVLFIISEVMIFFGVFWGYFHSSLNPSVELGAIWPPKELEVLEW
jgi:cytochrome c oxidase subunit 3